VFISRLKPLVKKPWLLPDKVLAYLLVKLRQRVTLSTDSFGWLQAILYTGIDQWQRYGSVAQQIRTLDDASITVLDVGGSSGTIRKFLDCKRYRLCVLDVNIQALAKIDDLRLGVIAGDGCCLPFKDNSFDVVISVDSLEHVPDANKAAYCQELKRVAKRYVIVHCPADSSDGEFQGAACDAKFLQWHQQRFERNEPNTLEHLNSGLPKVDELRRLFPEANVAGKQNAHVWFKYMTISAAPYIRLVAGLLYKLRLQNKDDLPPYHACLLMWRKR
jgi:ubiquinone/menaquinone biosynthesis C-methylase UbiE